MKIFGKLLMDRNIFFYVFLISVFRNFLPKTKRGLAQNVSEYQLDL